MTAYDAAVIRRPRRRTHLADPVRTDRVYTWCGVDVPSRDATTVTVSLLGGATTRLRNDLVRELDNNTCLRCTRIAAAMLALYASRDLGQMP